MDPKRTLNPSKAAAPTTIGSRRAEAAYEGPKVDLIKVYRGAEAVAAYYSGEAAVESAKEIAAQKAKLEAERLKAAEAAKARAAAGAVTGARAPIAVPDASKVLAPDHRATPGKKM
jgi:hypothetical protein